jgi:hypothetical protein
VELAPLNVTTCPVTGEVGAYVKLAVGGGSAGAGAVTIAVNGELAELDPPALVAVTATRIFLPTSLAASL